MQPLLIRRISEYVNTKSNAPVADNEGWGLTAAIGLVYIGLALTTAIFYHEVYRTVTCVRGALVMAIFAKTVLLPAGIDESASLTLMSTDVERICEAMPNGHELWASPIEVGLGVWLLSRQIGVALLGPLVVTVISVGLTMLVSSRMAKAMGSWMTAIQTRIDFTAKMLGNIKEIKLLGISSVVSGTILRLRTEEIHQSLKSRRLMAALLTVANFTLAGGAPAAFIIYIAANQSGTVPLNVSRAFTTLSLVSLVTGPVRDLAFSIGPVISKSLHNP